MDSRPARRGATLADSPCADRGNGADEHGHLGGAGHRCRGERLDVGVAQCRRPGAGQRGRQRRDLHFDVGGTRFEDHRRDPRGSGTIQLLLSGAPASVGTQGYQLTITGTAVVVRANQPAGLFAGVQTLLQLLPATVESPTVMPGPWTAPGGTVVDYPRFAHRGAMLDVARHFFTVAQIERYIDEVALYKINYLHLHLSDDQGWRIAINSWPNLAVYGGSTEVGGGPGGYYTQADYSAIVAYAQSRYITVVPEIDMPGHTNAALASYAQLNCNGFSPCLKLSLRVSRTSVRSSEL